MGLFSTSHFHSSDNSTHIRYPDTVNVHEHKAPTDESIRLMEEMHDKALKNIIAKVKVDDNLVKGECFLLNQPWNDNELKMIFKFKINGTEFNIEREFSRRDLDLNDRRVVDNLFEELQDNGKALMVWYTLKMFAASAYEQMTGREFPKELIDRM